MAFSGSTGLTLRTTNAVLPTNFPNTFTMAGFVWSSTPPSTSSDFDVCFGFCGGPFQNPQGNLHWDHTFAPAHRAMNRRVWNGSYVEATFPSLVTNQWIHLAVTYDGSITRSYQDGVLVGTSVAAAPGANNPAFATAIGAVNGVGDPELIAVFPNGRTAEVAYWDALLSQDEIESLAKGFRPSRVRINNLGAYFPNVREASEMRHGSTTTVNGSIVVADHPRVF